MHPYLGGLISQERQRETIARADRQRLLRGLARQARRTGNGAAPAPHLACRAAAAPAAAGAAGRAVTAAERRPRAGLDPTGQAGPTISAMRVRLAIGDFSRMTHLSVKALRHYHDVGLLAPAEIDPVSGYRFYEPGQLPTAQVIRRFRDLGMPLEEIKEVLEAPDVAARNEVIVAHLERMESQLAETQSVVASLRSLLERPPAPIAVEHRSVGPVRALAIRGQVTMPELDAWLDAAQHELDAALAAAGACRGRSSRRAVPGRAVRARGRRGRGVRAGHRGGTGRPRARHAGDPPGRAGRGRAPGHRLPTWTSPTARWAPTWPSARSAWTGRSASTTWSRRSTPMTSPVT